MITLSVADDNHPPGWVAANAGPVPLGPAALRIQYAIVIAITVMRNFSCIFLIFLVQFSIDAILIAR